MHAQFVSDEMANQTRDREYFRKLYDDFSLNFFSLPTVQTKLRITFHGDDPQRWICAK